MDPLALFAGLADVVEEDIPDDLDLDAVALGLVGRPTLKLPRVVLNRSRADNERRRRFTVAHELGHLCMPWHTGLRGCNTDRAGGGTELEANLFARRLLVPRTWLEEAVVPLADADRLKALDKCAVSHIPAVLALGACLPANSVIVLTRNGARSGAVTTVLAGHGTVARLPERGQALDSQLTGSEHGREVVAGRSVFWLRYPARVAVPVRVNLGTSRDLLGRILADVPGAGTAVDTLRRRLAGYVGAANAKLLASPQGVTPETLLAVLRQRLAGVDDLDELIAHPLFGDYLVSRATELASPDVRRRPSGSA